MGIYSIDDKSTKTHEMMISFKYIKTPIVLEVCFNKSTPAHKDVRCKNGDIYAC